MASTLRRNMKVVYNVLEQT